MRSLPLLFATLSLITVPGIAWAHTHVIASSPRANVAVAPMNAVSITFSERTIPAFSGADIVMTSMPGMAAHAPMKLNGMRSKWSTNGRTLTLTAARPLSRGTYRVSWHAAGTDTHRMQGNYSFTVR